MNIDSLRSTAEELRETLAAGTPERPLFVEFSGSPKSGKSTCIEIVAHFFRRLGFRILAPTEGASKRTPYYLKDDLVAFNTWSASYALTHVLEGLYNSDRYHIAILDRGIFDALVWFELLAADGEISDDKRDRIQSFLLIDNWRSVIDAVFLFTTDPDTSLEREVQDKLVSDPGRAMNPEFLKKLNDAYRSVQKRYSKEFRFVQYIDTSGGEKTTPQSTAIGVVDSILQVWKGRL